MSGDICRALALGLGASLILAHPLSAADYYGTLEPFVSEAVYFAVTDRFVDGDAGNNYPTQGGEQPSFDRPLDHGDGAMGNIGYLGGDFRGLLDNADYIREMGFTALWITPIVDNPDQSFTGGDRLGEATFADRGKSGYHGYWGVNFYREDEHLVSPDLDFAEFSRQLRERHGIKLVLDIVANHGSPAFTMPEQQPGFGQLYDADGNLVADHQNLRPEELDPNNPLHRFFHREPDLAQLSNLDDTNPEVVEYLVGAYLQWIEQGAAAFRIDTIRHVPHAFWKTFSDRIRAQHPGFFMFGEAFDYDAIDIAPHTFPENGGVSVLDFPGKQLMTEVFVEEGGDFAALPGYLHLDDGMYRNPYELAIFYDNHDMPRVDARDEQYIDLHNWLFTSRGFPVVYYGSEVGFMSGAAEHYGNRNFFGQARVDAATEHPVRQALARVARLRQASPALQRGLQINLDFSGDTAAFLRVYQRDAVRDTVLVLLNKGSTASTVTVDGLLGTGPWVDLESGEGRQPGPKNTGLSAEVPAHGLRILRYLGDAHDKELILQMDAQMEVLHASGTGGTPGQ